MAYTFPFDVCRPLRTYDGATSSEQFNPTQFYTMWGNPEIQSSSITIEIHGDEDVRIGDLVRLPYNLFNRR